MANKSYRSRCYDALTALRQQFKKEDWSGRTQDCPCCNEFFTPDDRIDVWPHDDMEGCEICPLGVGKEKSYRCCDLSFYPGYRYNSRDCRIQVTYKNAIIAINKILKFIEAANSNKGLQERVRVETLRIHEAFQKTLNRRKGDVF
jgi:hypothetical protein